MKARYLSSSGFSEFETYGNYVDTFYKGVYKHKRVESLRQGAVLFGMSPSEEDLLWASKDYDMISFEEHTRMWMKSIVSINLVRNLFHLKDVYSFLHSLELVWKGIKDTFHVGKKRSDA